MRIEDEKLIPIPIAVIWAIVMIVGFTRALGFI